MKQSSQIRRINNFTLSTTNGISLGRELRLVLSQIANIQYLATQFIPHNASTTTYSRFNHQY